LAEAVVDFFSPRPPFPFPVVIKEGDQKGISELNLNNIVTADKSLIGLLLTYQT
jgi:hypothetical protein